jgi:thiol:disulfide interchange protein DsbD
MVQLVTMSPTDAFDATTLSTYAWAFGQGVLVDLTPCVYPLIPITVAVFGAKGVSRGRALFLASAYVLGMATLYTTLGVIVALSGGQFGAWLGEPVVVLPIVGVLLALAASMFGAFELQLPASVQTRLNSVGGTGPVGAFLMGLVSGFISAPCTGPVLLSLLAYIAKASAEGHSLAYGASLLFTYALGMGTLFFAVALGASLFRPGRWMEYVKSVFGVGLLVMSLWFLAPLSAGLRGLLVDPTWGVYVGLGLTALGLAAGAIHLSFYGEPREKVRKGLAVASTVLGLQVVVNNTLYATSAAWVEVRTIEELEAALARVEASGRPLVIDFGATWCSACIEMEKLTFHHASIQPELESRFELVKIDVTQQTDENQTIQRAFASDTLPSVLLYPSQVRFSDHFAALREGSPMPSPAHQVRQFTPADEFGPLLADVK